MLNIFQRKNNIILVGFCSCGKSTIGRALAKSLQFDWIDTDVLVEERSGLSIEFLLSKDVGLFRMLELDVLRNFNGTSCVVSTGSGTPCSLLRFLLLRRLGTLVWLDVPFEITIERIFRRKDHCGANFSLTSSQKKYIARRRYYRFADHRVKLRTESPADIAEILKKIVD